jgi:sec-independent protein translocase protein TatC
MAPNVLEEQEMGIWDHLSELRSRLLKAMAALLITTLVSMFYLAPVAIEILAIPAGGLSKFVTIEVTESVSVYMRVALLTGFIMSLPVIVFQILAFVVPGLYENERRWVFIAIPVATLLFIGGVAFTYFVLLQTALPFLDQFLNVESSWRIANYVGFVTNLMFWIGLAFETPLVVFLLAKFKVVTPAMLGKQWRFAVVIIAIVAAVITPTPDPVTMGMTMAPLFAIYLLSILFAAIAAR